MPALALRSLCILTLVDNNGAIKFEVAGDVIALTRLSAGELAALVRAASSEAMKQRKPLTCAVSVEMKFFVAIPIDWSDYKREQAEDGKLQVTRLKETEIASRSLIDALAGVAYQDKTLLCETRSARLYDTRPRVELSISKWILRFVDTSDICLETSKMETLRKAQQRVAKFYRVRALHEELDRQMTPVFVEIYRQELFETTRIVEREKVRTEARRLKLDHAFDGLIDIVTGSIYRDNVCISTNQLEIISGPLKRKAKTNGADHDSNRSEHA